MYESKTEKTMHLAKKIVVKAGSWHQTNLSRDACIE